MDTLVVVQLASLVQTALLLPVVAPEAKAAIRQELLGRETVM